MSIRLPKAEALANMARCRNDFVYFVEEIVGAKPYDYQRDILEAACNPEISRIAWHTAHGVGKTASMAWLTMAFLFTRADSRVITTASVNRQVRDVLWPEIHKWMRKAQPNLYKIGWRWPYNLLDERLEITRDWFALGASSDKPENMEGQHADHMLYIVDEAKTVEKGIFEAIEGALTGRIEAKLFVVSTPPMAKEGHFYEICSGKFKGWKIFHTRASESPNVSPEWIVAKKEEWGENSPVYLSRVEGEFPDSSESNLISTSWVEKSNQRWVDNVSPGGETVLGVDPARYGCFDDQTELLTRRGWRKFGDVTGTDEVLSLVGDTASWSHTTAIHKYWFDGHLNLYDGEKINFCVTDNHNFIYRSRKSKNYKIKQYADLPGAFIVRRTNSWTGESPDSIEFVTEYLDRGGERYVSKVIAFDFRDWAEFMGWYLSEGCAWLDARNHGRISIAQDGIANPVKCAEISQLLSRMGIKFRRKNRQFDFYSNPIADHLIFECGTGASNKRVPEYIKNGSLQTLETFLYAFARGDGYIRSDGTRTYSTSSKMMADDIQEILAKIGRAGKLSTTNCAGTKFVIEGRIVTRRHDTYSVIEKSRPCDSDVKKSKVTRIGYRGFVYCVSVPGRVIMVRRQGLCMWSGNSDETVIAKVTELYVWPLEIHVKQDTMQTAGQVIRAIEKHHAVQASIDTIGVGAGVYDRVLEAVREQKIPCVVRPINVAQRSPSLVVRGERIKFKRMRDYLYWSLRELLDPVNCPEDELLSLPPDLKLKSQLTSIRYKINSNGEIEIESKDELKKRGYSSPDRAEAVMMAVTKGYTGWTAVIS